MMNTETDQTSGGATMARPGDPADMAWDAMPRRRYSDRVLGALRLHVKRRAGIEARSRTGAADWQADYLLILGQLLAAEGLPESDCRPLREIAEAIRQSGAPAEFDHDALFAEEYAKESAAISFLILTGVSEVEAAQRVAREMFARGIPLPVQGGDARGWKRLLEFRDKLRHSIAPEPLVQLYRDTLDRLKHERRT